MSPGTRRYYMSRSSPPKRSRFKGKRHSIHTRKGLIEELDRVTSLIVRKRDGRCVTCPESRPEYLTCSHFYKRAWLNVRFDLINCNCQCFNCNDRHNVDVWPYTSWFVEKYGTDVMHELFEKRNVKRKVTTEELRELLDEYRLTLRQMSKAA